MPKRNVATNYTFEQQRQEINLIAADLWDGVLGGASTDFSTVVGWGNHGDQGYLKKDGSVSTTAAFTFGNKIIGPSTFTIEPTNVNGTVVIAGNLQVDGTQTAVNSTTMDVTDLNITVAKGAANSAAADTAGITVDGANATLQYEDGSPGTWESSLGFRLDGKNGSAGLALDLAGSADYLIRESTTDDIVQFGGTGAANFFAHNLSSGNIGIANANPSYKLDVTGTLRATGNSTFGGSVGIGTDGPTQLLEINGGSSPCVLVKDTTNDVIAYLFADDNNAYVGAASNHPVIIKQNNGTALTVDTSKRVVTPSKLGVGGITPTAMIAIPAQASGASGVVRLAIESQVDDNDFTISQYEDASGTYTLIGQNCDLGTGGSEAVLDSGHRTAGILLDGRNHGRIEFYTGDTNTITKTLTLDKTQNATFEGFVHVKDNNAVYIGSSNDLSLFHDQTDCRIRYNHTVGSLKFQKNDNSNVLTLDGSGNAEFAGILDAARVDCNGLFHIQYGTSTDTNYMSSFSNNNGIMHLFRGDGLYIGDNMNTSNQAGGPNLSKIRLKTDGNIESDGEVSDWKGRLRRIPQNYQASNYQLVASDSGKHIATNSVIEIPASVYSNSGGDAVTIVNHGTSDITITQGSGLTMYNAAAGDGSTGDRTLAQKGVATLLFINATVCHISGAGLS